MKNVLQNFFGFLLLIAVADMALAAPAQAVLTVTARDAGQIDVCFVQPTTSYGPLRANLVQVHSGVFNNTAIYKEAYPSTSLFLATGTSVSFENPATGVNQNGVGTTGQLICTRVIGIPDGVYKVQHIALDNCTKSRGRCDMSPYAEVTITVADGHPYGDLSLAWDSVVGASHYILRWGPEVGTRDYQVSVPATPDFVQSTKAMDVPFGPNYFDVIACDVAEENCSAPSKIVGATVFF